jgi:DNA polymerase (family 10)
MNNRDIASLLKNIALYKDLSGDNPFKIRAFEGAARIIETFSEDIADIARRGRLTDIKGIGKGVEEIVLEYIELGHSEALESLKAEFPTDLPELLTIPGMGPKKVKAVWEKLGVSSIGELEYACKENRLLTLEGFGVKSQEKILNGIEFKKQYRDRHLISEALSTAKSVISSLDRSDLFTKVSVAGSLRRGKSIFKDIDILVVPQDDTDTNSVKNTLIAFADKSDAGGIIGAGPTKVSIRTQGIQIDFRIIQSDSYPPALQHFTGSKEHNTLLRSRAKHLGLKMNEYGIFKGTRALTVQSEEEVYARIGLSFIPPEIREGRGEVLAAEKNALPQLVVRSDIRGMIHVHSNYSDGAHSIEFLADECRKRGFSYLCISDHSRSAFYANGLSADRVLEQIDEIERLNSQLKPFRIFCGIESDILPDGSLDYSGEILGKLDYTIGSIHSKLSMTPEEATSRLLKAIKNPYLTILGHISGRLLLSREGYSYDEDTILDALSSEKVVLEHNCNPHRLDPDWPFLKKASERGICISLGPDAHSKEGFDDIDYGLIMARKSWMRRDDLLNCKSGEEMDEFFRERKKEKGISDI